MKKSSLKTLRKLDAFKTHGLINETAIPALEKVVETFSSAITPTMLQLINKNDPHDPIARQFVPDQKELLITPEEMRDPIGDEVHKKVNGIIHRYPDRCLFTPVHVCPVYCRFCFRKEKVGRGEETLTSEELDAAFHYIETHTEIWEVILTGGDPLILKPAVLKKIMTRLSQIKHIEIIRFHTRVPLVDPARIDEKMLDALQSTKTVYILLHANHLKEFTEAAISACKTLINSGITLLSQTTLLKGINDSIEALSELMRFLVKYRIKPYYLHQTDLARGTQHFRTTLEESQQLMRQLRGRLSGLCQPTLVLDIPGGFGKVPVGPNYVNQNEEGYIIEDYLGEFHSYK